VFSLGTIDFTSSSSEVRSTVSITPGAFGCVWLKWSFVLKNCPAEFRRDLPLTLQEQILGYNKQSFFYYFFENLS
jgi:hypothetical protein